MIIKKIINNNYCVLSGKEERIVMGRGIAFGKRVGDQIEEYEIEKEFQLSNDQNLRELQNLLIDVDPALTQLIHDHIYLIEKVMNKEVNDVLYISLLDHMSGAIQRYQEGFEIQNNLVHEIKQFYPQEFQLADSLIKTINQHFKTQLTDNEAGFVAMHVINGLSFMADDLGSDQLIKMIKEIVTIVEHHFEVNFDENSISYYRFVTHLKMFGHRVFQNSLIDLSFSNEAIVEALKNKYKEAYQCSLKVKNYLIKSLYSEVAEEELIYLTIHIQRMITEEREKRSVV